MMKENYTFLNLQEYLEFYNFLEKILLKGIAADYMIGKVLF